MTIKNVAIFVKTLNLITGVGLLVVSVLSIIDIKDWLTFRVFLIPCPFFVGLFGICIIGAQLKVKAITKKLSFLKTLAGRGIFNIFLSSTAFWFLQSSEILAWVSALILFITGIIYIVFECGYGKELEKQSVKEQEKEQTRKNVQKSKRSGRQNLI